MPALLIGVAGRLDHGVVLQSEGGSLTPLELRLLPLLATPLSLTEIAVLVELPRSEVERHAASIFRKLEIGAFAEQP